MINLLRGLPQHPVYHYDTDENDKNTEYVKFVDCLIQISCVQMKTWAEKSKPFGTVYRVS
jgi:hypothetical protein